MKIKVLYTNARACDTILQYLKYSRIIKNVKMYNVHNRKLQLKCQWTSIFLIKKKKQYRVHVDDCPLGYIPYFFILNRLIQHISYNVNYLFPRLVKRFQSRSTQKKLRPSMTGRCIYALDVEWYIFFFSDQGTS